MADIPAGWALRNDLAHQIAVPTRNCRHSKALKNVAITPQFADSAPLQDEVVAMRVRLIRTKAGLDKLPSRTREIVLMRKLDGLKYIEIAERRSFPRIACWRDSSKPRGGAKGVRIIEIN